MNDTRLDMLCDINPETLSPISVTNFKFRYLDISAVSKGVIDWNLARLISFSDAPSRARRVLREGDVLLCTVRPGLQAHSRISVSPIEPLVASTGFAVLRPRERGDSGFIFHQLFSDSVSRQLAAMETGSNYPAVNERDVRALKLFVPHSTERARIAAVLDAADHEIERTQALIEKLKQIRTGLLRDLLTRGLDEKGELRDPILCPEQFRNSPLGRIPRQWKIARIDDAIERPGDLAIGPFGSNLLASDYRENGAPVVFVRDVREDEFFWKSCVYIDQDKAAELSAHSVCPGDLLITKMGLPPCTAAVYPEGMPEGVITADVIRLRARVSLVMSHWLSAYINSAIFAACVRRITGGVTRPKVTLTDFREQPVLLPPLAEQQRIETVLQAMSTEITEAKAESDKLKLLKSGLMSDLLTGRVQIPSIFLETTA